MRVRKASIDNTTAVANANAISSATAAALAIVTAANLAAAQLLGTGTWTADLGPTGLATRTADPVSYQNNSGGVRRVIIEVDSSTIEGTELVYTGATAPPLGTKNIAASNGTQFVYFEVGATRFYMVNGVILSWKESDG